MTDQSRPRLTSLAHGGGCGCKIAPDVLRDILGDAQISGRNRDLLVDASTSDDAAVYRISDDAAVIATTDFFMPIVDDPFEFGRIAATNALSDIYAMGGRPIFGLAIVGMPVDKMDVSTIRAILEGGRTACEAAGAPIAGGHSIDSAEPIYGVVGLGLVHPDKILTNARARPGDALVLGKPLGIGVYSAALKRGELSEADYAEMLASTTRLNTPGAELGSIDGVHAATDVTGFGLLGHLGEICRASNLGAAIEFDATPIFAGARALVEAGIRTGASARNWRSIGEMVDLPAALSGAPRDLLTDPQTSGGLLVSCKPGAVDAVLGVFERHGHFGAAVIGEIAAGPPRITVR